MDTIDTAGHALYAAAGDYLDAGGGDFEPVAKAAEAFDSARFDAFRELEARRPKGKLL